MKKYIVLLGIFLALSQIAYAHPPKSIESNYDPSDKTLSVTVTHPVRNPKGHYIEKIEIVKNDELIAKKEFSEQDNNVSQNAVFIVSDITAQDTVIIEAYCSISGKLKEKVDIGK